VNPLAATPFVPGVVRGRLHHGPVLLSALAGRVERTSVDDAEALAAAVCAANNSDSVRALLGVPSGSRAGFR